MMAIFLNINNGAIFLIENLKHRLCVLIRMASRRRSNEYTHNDILNQHKENKVHVHPCKSPSGLVKYFSQTYMYLSSNIMLSISKHSNMLSPFSRIKSGILQIRHCRDYSCETNLGLLNIHRS